jgi:glyoxylase-like metal-dependent hydrolase (beta-lactamase superfamily II)
MAACPVAAIRLETEAHRHHRGLEALTDQEKALAKNMALSPKLNGHDLPFPRPLTHKVWYLGHHNEKSFGATPYLLHTSDEQWIMVDTPRFGKSAIEAITSLTGSSGPDFLLLTHVDDTADHGKWVEEFPSLRRIFHSGDLGRHNWLGDATLEHVEILLEAQSSSGELQAFDLDGTMLTSCEAAQKDVVIYHTPGHSPGSISLLDRPSGVIFTGDTLGYSNRLDTLTGFPRYGNDRSMQARLMKLLDWTLVSPGHGHVRDYGASKASRDEEVEDAIQELVTRR